MLVHQQSDMTSLNFPSPHERDQIGQAAARMVRSSDSSRHASGPTSSEHSASLPDMIPVINGTQQVSDRRQARVVENPPSTCRRANSVVDEQIRFINQGPFQEPLKQKLIAEVLSFATEGESAGASQTSKADNGEAESEFFRHQMDRALKISEVTQQPNDPKLKPSIGVVRDFALLVGEHRSHKMLHEKLMTLLPQISRYRPVIGDGNCFYRCLAFGMVETALRSGVKDLKLLKVRMKNVLHKAKRWLSSTSAQRTLGEAWNSFSTRADIIIDAGYRSFRTIVHHCLSVLENDHHALPELVAMFQDNVGDDVMHLIRQLVAYEMLSKHSEYETFLPAIEGLQESSQLGEELSVSLVVRKLVVVNGKEAEHVMIQALSSLLHVLIGVVYVDGEGPPVANMNFIYDL